ncbi:MAG: response regulator transcription factor [Kiritimatiellia bacterium]
MYPTAADALRNSAKARADVALVDLHLPGMGGVECIAALKAAQPALLSLVLTTFDESELLFDALKAGACGYLLKRTPPADIVEAIHQARAGGSPMSLQIARKVVSHFHQATAPPLQSVLSDREQAVIQLLAKGARYKDIAESLYVSIETVRSHIKNIYTKLQAHSRTEAVNKFRSAGPLQGPVRET